MRSRAAPPTVRCMSAPNGPDRLYRQASKLLDDEVCRHDDVWSKRRPLLFKAARRLINVRLRCIPRSRAVINEHSEVRMSRVSARRSPIMAT